MADSPRYRAIIADDEPAARDAIATFLAEVPAVEVVARAANGKEAVARVREHAPDLLFLDVQMPDLDGFGVLEALGDAAPAGVVFVTAHDEHALRAFDVHALDYVLKPFGRPRFMAAVERALRRLAADEALSARRTLNALLEGRRARGRDPASVVLGPPSAPSPGPGQAGPTDSTARWPARLGVRLGSRTLLVDVSEIDWVEADGDYARLHVGDATHLVSERMHALEESLDPARFLRIHRSAIVSLLRIQELRRDPDGGGSVILTNDVRLRVSRRRWDALEAALGLDG